MANSIESRGNRDKLAVQREPHWVRLRAGCFLGYRKMVEGDGTWVVRWRSHDGKQRFHSLGSIVDDGSRHGAYAEALKRAEKWLHDVDAGVSTKKVTVRKACEIHIDALRLHDGNKKADAEDKRLQRLVYDDPISNIELGKLRPEHMQAWRKRLVELPALVTRSKKGDPVTRQRSASTTNRDMVPLRAALNRALDDGLVVTDIAWRKALKPIESADRRRDIYLSKEQRRSLIQNAEAEIAPFLCALSMLPLRPGALAALNVGDFSPRLRSLRIGVDKSGQERRITLPDQTAKFFVTLAKGKLPTAPLLSRADGRTWDKDAWKWPIKAAAVAAGLPTGTTAYTLRHSTITDLVVGGLDMLTVAKLAGTSVLMIERHYGHLQQERAAQALAGLSL